MCLLNSQAHPTRPLRRVTSESHRSWDPAVTQSSLFFKARCSFNSPRCEDQARKFRESRQRASEQKLLLEAGIATSHITPAVTLTLLNLHSVTNTIFFIVKPTYFGGPGFPRWGKGRSDGCTGLFPLHGGGPAGRWAAIREPPGIPPWEVATCPWGGAAARFFTPLRWRLCVSHGPVAILAATTDCLQPRWSQYWHLGFLFLNPALKESLGAEAVSP